MTDVIVPSLGDIEDAEVTAIAVSVGDAVSEGQALLTLETDKAAVDIEAESSGTVAAINVNPGDRVTAGTVVITLESRAEAPSSTVEQATEEDQSSDQKSTDNGAEAAVAPETSTEKTSPTPSKQDEPVQQPTPPAVAAQPIPTSDNPSEAVRAGPAVRKYARELGVDVSVIRPSGPNGLLLRDDVNDYVRQRLTGSGKQLADESLPLPDFTKYGETHSIDLSKINRVTGLNLKRSWLTAPQVTHHDEADITNLLAHKKAQADKGNKLSFLPYIIQATTSALREHERLRSSLSEDGKSLIIKDYFHIGIAVDTEAGLMVPVLRDADQLDLTAIQEQVQTLAQSARNNKLKLDQLSGSVFTISSLGHIGGTGFSPIVNTPEVGILGISATRNYGKPILPLSLSYDHRVVDGVLAAKFVRHIATELENIA